MGSAPVESAWCRSVCEYIDDRSVRRSFQRRLRGVAADNPLQRAHTHEAAEWVLSQWSNRGTGDQEVVEAFGAQGPDGAFRDRVGARRSNWGARLRLSS